MWTLAHRKLQEACIYLWPNIRDCRVLVTESGMDPASLDFDEPPALRWQSVISEAEKQNAMGKLVPVLLARYPDNMQLKSACAPFAAAEPVSALTAEQKSEAIPSVQPPPVPAGAVLVPKFDAEPIKIPVTLDETEAAATIASLRIVAIETERRLVALENWRKRIGSLSEEIEIPIDE